MKNFQFSPVSASASFLSGMSALVTGQNRLAIELQLQAGAKLDLNPETFGYEEFKAIQHWLTSEDLENSVVYAEKLEDFLNSLVQSDPKRVFTRSESWKGTDGNLNFEDKFRNKWLNELLFLAEDVAQGKQYREPKDAPFRAVRAAAIERILAAGKDFYEGGLQVLSEGENGPEVIDTTLVEFDASKTSHLATFFYDLSKRVVEKRVELHNRIAGVVADILEEGGQDAQAWLDIEAAYAETFGGKTTPKVYIRGGALKRGASAEGTTKKTRFDKQQAFAAKIEGFMLIAEMHETEAADFLALILEIGDLTQILKTFEKHLPGFVSDAEYKALVKQHGRANVHTHRNALAKQKREAFEADEVVVATKAMNDDFKQAVRGLNTHWNCFKSKQVITGQTA